MLVRIRISRRRRVHASAQPVAAGRSASAPSLAVDPHQPAKPRLALGASSRVALGILVSRLTGLARERFIAHYFGLETVVADAFRAAIRIPNLLGTLFGEGVLSAAFVTVYAKLRAAQQDEEAEHVAAAVFGILALVSSVLVLLAISFTPIFIDLVAPGFKHDERGALTIHLVRIVFAATGLSVLSAWCLGVLNSHRRFLLSYLAPVALNLTVIAALISFGRHSVPDRLVSDAAWAYVGGSALQFLVQLPKVLEILPGFRPVLEWRSPHVRSVLRNFGPIFLSRGVVQISAYIDQMIASWLPKGAVAALFSGQVITILPISLFSMSVSAAELPMLSSAIGNEEEVAAFLRGRLSGGLRRIAFFIVPSAVAFLLLGDVLGAALYQTGQFHHSDTVYLWSVLAGSAVGLLATSLGRLYSSAFYALLHTRSPLRFAIVRVVLTTGLGLLFALQGPYWLGIDRKWGVAGLTASAGIAGWVEFALLRHALGQRIGKTPLSSGFVLKLWSAAFVGGCLGYLIKKGIGFAHPLLLAFLVLPVYAIVYFGGTLLLGINESRTTIASVLRRVGLNFSF
ncbi:MAG: murein biosynthesis integral membrane protein MurJ [Acidobacteriaceae bacterium]|nr:murein biosynthesis integral membrane protein MurJ [Acidobacteriaceae bacterium]